MPTNLNTCNAKYTDFGCKMKN